MNKRTLNESIINTYISVIQNLPDRLKTKYASDTIASSNIIDEKVISIFGKYFDSDIVSSQSLSLSEIDILKKHNLFNANAFIKSLNNSDHNLEALTDDKFCTENKIQGHTIFQILSTHRGQYPAAIYTKYYQDLPDDLNKHILNNLSDEVRIDYEKDIKNSPKILINSSAHMSYFKSMNNYEKYNVIKNTAWTILDFISLISKLNNPEVENFYSEVTITPDDTSKLNFNSDLLMSMISNFKLICTEYNSYVVSYLFEQLITLDPFSLTKTAIRAFLSSSEYKISSEVILRNMSRFRGLDCDDVISQYLNKKKSGISDSNSDMDW